jgi:hypothetical protein
LIFSLYGRVKVKLGDDESYIYDRKRLMYTESDEIERITGWSYGEWAEQLSRYSIKAVAALLHILRKREGRPSDFATMQFNAAELDVVPLHEDDTEFTAEEVAADFRKRLEAAQEAANPTSGTDGSAAPPGARETSGSSRSSPSGSGSGPGSGSSSPGTSSAGSRGISTLRPLPAPAPRDAAAEVGEDVGHDGGDVAADAFGVVG